MRIWLGRVCVLALGLFVSLPARAQSVPKPGDEYEDTAVVGFKIKMPSGWQYVPPQPGDDNKIGSYTAGEAGLIRRQADGRPLFQCDIELLKFVRTPKPEATAEENGKPRFTRPVIENFSAFLSSRGGKWKLESKKEVTVAKLASVRYVYLGEEDKVPIRMLAYEYKLRPDCDVAVMFFGPGEDKKWGKFESAYDSMGKSFKSLALASTGATGPRGETMRDKKRFALETQLAAQPGWQLYETPNYFVVSAKNDDKPFMDEILVRLEAIREVYENVYPAAFAAELKQIAKTRKANEEKKEGPATSGDGLTETEKKVDSMELSRCSVVRVCKDEEQYHSYGGPGGSAGYWNWGDEELVIYDDQKSGGRRNTWAVLNHEAFHQYVFYFFGQLSPHSWFNEGTGDYFSGYQLERNKFVLKAFDWRQRLIQVNIRQDKFAPLKEIVRWTQGEYYGGNKYDLDGGDNYAQGWSFIYFLRTAKKGCKCWNPAWETILDTYLRTLVETDDLDAAVDKAFSDVDWDALEKCWKEYTLDG